MQLNASIIAAGCGATVLRAASWVQPLQAACDKYWINTPLRVAAFLATIGVESGRLVWTSEIWGPTPTQMGYSHRSDLGNTKPEAIAIAARHGSTPGPWWRGHGLIQTTGYDNHLATGKALGLDLLNHPELLAQPDNAAMSAGWYWDAHDLNQLSDFGKFEAVCRAVNLGNPNSTKTPNGYSERLALYSAAKKALGINSPQA